MDDNTIVKMPAPPVRRCACGGQMRLHTVALHEKVRDVEVLVFACPECERRLHVIQPL